MALRHRESMLLEPLLHQDREPVHAARDTREPFGAVIHRIHRGHDREQHLRGADVRSGLLAPDVLFARLQREAVCGLALGVHRHAHQSPGHAALQLIARGHVAGMRPAEAHRHSEALRIADRDVRAPLARRLEEREREQIRGDHEIAASRVQRLGNSRMLADLAVHARVLHQRAEGVERRDLVGRHDAHFDAERLGARAHDVDRLGEHVVGDREKTRSALRRAQAERHRLGRRGRFVEHRSIGDGHAGEVGHHRLEIDERFQPPLRDLRLVGRIGGVPGRVLEDVAKDDAGCVGLVITLADVRLEHEILLGDAAKACERLALGSRRADVHGAAAAYRLRHDRVDEIRARGEAQRGDHRCLLGGIGADVATLEGAMVLEGLEGCARGAGDGRVRHGDSPRKRISRMRRRRGACPRPRHWMA